MIFIIMVLLALLPVIMFNMSLKVWLLLLGLGALWWLSLLVWPHKRCTACRGKGARLGPFNFMRTCGVCKGSGRELRWGAGER